VLASDIPANLEVGLSAGSYFPLGDISSLAERVSQLAAAPLDEAGRERRRHWVLEHYDWGRIAQQTYAVYDRVLKQPRPLGRSIV
jgi:glycosyltransferase involved in cell wall biosynthesis